MALDGTALVFDRKANRNFYGHDVTTDDILGGTVSTNAESARASSRPSSPAHVACYRQLLRVPAPPGQPAARGHAGPDSDTGSGPHRGAKVFRSLIRNQARTSLILPIPRVR